MSDLLDLLITVWSVPALFGAVVAGIGIGWVVSMVIRDDSYGDATATARVFGYLVGAMSALAFTVFWLTQISDAVLQADPNAPRLISRWTISLIYSAFMGFGTWLSLRRHAEHR